MIFKEGDRVFDIRYGWGKITHIVSENKTAYQIKVNFESGLRYSYSKCGRLYNTEIIPTLSFTEYTLQGFSQERPKKEPEIGSLCLFNDYECDLIKNMGYTGYLHEIQNTDYPYLKRDGKWFKFCKQIKIEEI